MPCRAKNDIQIVAGEHQNSNKERERKHQRPKNNEKEYEGLSNRALFRVYVASSKHEEGV